MADPPSPLAAAVVLVYNRWGLLPRCLPALFDSTYPNLRVLVVDNGSSVPCPDNARPLLDRCTVLRTPKNLGYAGGNNVGIARALDLGAEYVLLINDDAYVEKGCLEKLVAAMVADPRAGAVGPLVLDAREPGVVQSAGGLWDRGKLRGHHRDRGVAHRGQYDRVLPSDFVDGCCILLRASALRRVGALDEAFFLYYEEAELCHRLRTAGYSCLVVPWARVEHEGPRTGARGSPVTSYFSHRNRFLFVRRTSAGWRRAIRLPRSVDSSHTPGIRGREPDSEA
ncbi:MAG: glycosyltransferase family 2 protein [Methanobacteriota archaeon]|nr:MAG: glycosyltransferase family 2 protein [Euryarchaeota archaeon]